MLKIKKRKKCRYLISFIIFVPVIWLAVSIFNEWKAEVYLNHAQSLNPEVSKPLRFYNTSISLSSENSESYYRLAKYYEERALQKGISRFEKIEWLEKEKEELIKAIELEPTNAGYHLTLGWVYYHLFVYDNKMEYEKNAEREFRLAHKLYPSNLLIEGYVIRYLTRLKTSINQ